MNPKGKILSVCMAAAITASSFVMPAGSVLAQESVQSDQPNGENLWITEIYQNDVKRESVYGNASDQMEFVEVTNTTDRDISFNKEFGLWYEYKSGSDYTMKQLTVQTVDGSDEVVIPAGATAIFWSQRKDTDSYATEEEFREAMRVPDDVRVFTMSGQNGFAENDRGFAIKTASGEVVSHYRYNQNATDEVTADGLSVQLSVPDFGSEMLVYQAKKPTTAGVVSFRQLNGQKEFTAPTEDPQGVYITEIRPNDSNRDAEFEGSGVNDLMECVELTNTTDRAVDLNKEYALYYRIKENSTVELPIMDCNFSSENCVIPAHGTAVIWCYRKENLGDIYKRFPTEEDFREAYGLSDDVPVYIFTAQNGLGNTFRGFELYQKQEDGSKTLVSGYFWDGSSDLKDNKSVDLKVNPEGPQMLVYRSQSTTNMGVVSEEQLCYAPDDQSSPELAQLEEVTSVEQGEFVRIPYSYAGSDTMPVRAIELFYKTSEMDSYVSDRTTSFAIYNKWYAYIPSAAILNADYVDFYVKAENDYRTTMTPVKRVTVNHLDDGVEGLRVNLDTSKTLSGTVPFSAKDFSDGSAVLTAQVDGTAVSLNNTMENGAFFTFSYRGVDSYFQNALTTGSTVIRHFSKSSEIPTDSSMSILVDESLFTYHEDGSATIELTLRTGTYGSPWEWDTDANNDDFYISDMALSMTDGTVIRPDSVVSETGADLSKETEIKVGDSAGYNLYVTMMFTLPAGAADAVSGEIDTTALADGEHTLTVESTSGLRQSVTFTTDNTPEQTVTEEEPALHMDLTVSASKYPASAQVNGPEDTDEVKLYNATPLDDMKVYTGAGDSTANALAAQGFGTSASQNGQIPYQIFEISTDGASEGTLRVDVDAVSNDGKDVNLYAKCTETGEWELLDTVYENGKATAIFTMDDYVENGKVTILAQARGTEYTPYTEEQATADTVKNDYEWDGTAIPEQYDFALAWITDTQYYSEQYMQNFDIMTDWIVDNKDSLGIEYVLHTGDIVDEFNEEYQFINASEQLKKFEDASLPYGVLGGNHDVAHGNAVYDLYTKYFGASRYENNPWYGGTYDNNKGHYDFVTVDGEELLFLYMSWDTSDAEIEWMNEVLAKYPDKKAFICMHPGINANAEPDYFSDRVMNEVCSKNQNVIAVLNGHYHGSSLNFVGFDDNNDGVEDRVVYRICTDYQSAEGGGSGYVKMLYFDLANDKIYLNSYSPVLDDFNYYDREKLDSYGSGTVEYDIDITELSVDFDREEEKTLTVSDVSASVLTNELVGGGENGAEIPLSTKTGETATIYAVAYDSTGKTIAYSDAVTYTVNDGTVDPEEPGDGTQGGGEMPDTGDQNAALLLSTLLLAAAGLSAGGLKYWLRRRAK